jgi:hypothetical protein
MQSTRPHTHICSAWTHSPWELFLWFHLVVFLSNLYSFQCSFIWPCMYSTNHYNTCVCQTCTFSGVLTLQMLNGNSLLLILVTYFQTHCDVSAQIQIQMQIQILTQIQIKILILVTSNSLQIQIQILTQIQIKILILVTSNSLQIQIQILTQIQKKY